MSRVDFPESAVQQSRYPSASPANLGTRWCINRNDVSGLCCSCCVVSEPVTFSDGQEHAVRRWKSPLFLNPLLVLPYRPWAIVSFVSIFAALPSHRQMSSTKPYRGWATDAVCVALPADPVAERLSRHPFPAANLMFRLSFARNLAMFAMSPGSAVPSRKRTLVGGGANALLAPQKGLVSPTSFAVTWHSFLV